MDNIVESSVVKDFDNPPSKKIKFSEPDFLGYDSKLNSDLINSPVSPKSSEIDDDQQLEEDKQIKVNSDPDPITSPASPSIQKLSPIIELEDKQASDIDDDQQLEDKQTKGDTYDYVPQATILKGGGSVPVLGMTGLSLEILIDLQWKFPTEASWPRRVWFGSRQIHTWKSPLCFLLAAVVVLL